MREKRSFGTLTVIFRFLVVHLYGALVPILQASTELCHGQIQDYNTNHMRTLQEIIFYY